MVLKEGTYLGAIDKKTTTKEVQLSLTAHDVSSSAVPHQHINPYWSILIKGGYEEEGYSVKAQIIPGTIIYRPAYYEHTNQLKYENCQCFNVEIKKEFFSKNDTLTLPQKTTIYPPGTLVPFYELLHSFYQNNLTISSDLLDEINTSLSYLSSIKTAASDEVRWIKQLLDIIHSDLSANHSLDALSKQIFVHPVHLAKVFKKRTGMTIGTYRRKLRMEKAMELLFNTDEPVISVAHSLGFYDSAHFVRLFSQTYHCSPYQFRLRLKS